MPAETPRTNRFGEGSLNNYLTSLRSHVTYFFFKHLLPSGKGKMCAIRFECKATEIHNSKVKVNEKKSIWSTIMFSTVSFYR